ncbi:MAG: DsbA family protein [Paracoccaceae bacterium]|jgi:protein-disulfide isomerase|nr:DsbA family protein [Paracoccaceae bacterium]
MKRLLKFLALAFVLATPAQAIDLSAMTNDEKTAFGAAVREYLLENPEIIVEVISVLEERRAVSEAQSDRDLVLSVQELLFDDGFSHVSGNPHGDIEIVEFIDYRCGYCRKAHPEVKEMMAEDGNIRLVYKEYPILGEQSVIASRFAIATRLLFGGIAYENMQDTLMAFTGNYSEAALRKLAGAIDVDADAILEEMTSEKVTDEINNNRALGNHLAVTGTPTFVLEVEMLRGYVPKAQFAAMVEEVRASK